MLLIVALTALAALARSPALELQPKTYVSPSGGWSLRVEPLTRDGTGEADYTMTGGGREAWKARHSFALWEAAVTDDGRVAGYAYVGATLDHPRGGSLHVVVLSPNGEVLLDEPHERQSSNVLHSAAVPWSRGMFVQPELGRFSVRVWDQDRAESWWEYDLVTGEPLSSRHPTPPTGEGNVMGYPIALRAVPASPLVLLNWYHSTWEVEPYTTGAIFQLLDADLQPVWRLDLPHDYEARGHDNAKYQLMDELRRHGAILATGPGSFELRHVAGGLRVSYAIERTASGGWQVSEVARAPYAESTPSTATKPFRPELRAEIKLGGAAPARAEIRDILAFDFDAEGRLRFVREEEAGVTLVQLSESGAVRHAAPVSLEIGGDELLQWFPLDAPQWFAAVPSYVNGTTARAWFVDEETGASTQVPDLRREDVERVLELPDGRLLLLGSVHGLSLLANGATERWPKDEGHAWGAEDVTLTSNGQVVVLDNIRRSLVVYTEDGTYVETIDLTKSWGKKPNYPSSLVADRTGGVLVHDFHGDPALVRMTLDGEVYARLDARMPNGQAREEYRRAVRFAPDGRMWTTDGHEFVRLDEQGTADFQLGEGVRMDQLESPSVGFVDTTFGRVLLADDRTRALHVFDGEGRRVTLCQPRPEDLAELRFPMRMMCDSSGNARAAKSGFTNRHVLFGADGSALGVERLAGTCVDFLPGRQAYWCVNKSAPARYDEHGELELAFPKRADGNWWRSIQDIAVAADGRVAVLDLHGREGGLRRRPGEGFVALFDAEGKPHVLHALPEELEPDVVALAGRWLLLWNYSHEAWLLDTRDGSLRPLEIEKELDTKRSTSMGLSPTGDELWLLLPSLRTLRRYALPS